MLACGTAPDVMRVDHDDFLPLASKRFLAPLDPLIQADTSGFSLDDYSGLCHRLESQIPMRKLVSAPVLHAGASSCQ